MDSSLIPELEQMDEPELDLIKEEQMGEDQLNNNTHQQSFAQIDQLFAELNQ